MSLHATTILVRVLLALGTLLALALLIGLALGLRAILRRLSGGRFRGLSATVPGADAGPLPTEIMAALDAVPPLGRPRAAKAYRGMPVRWRVCYDTAFPSGMTTVRMMSTGWGTDYPWLYCDVSPRRFPRLRTLPKSAPLWVSGRIKSIDVNDIYLRDVRLEFDE